MAKTITWQMEARRRILAGAAQLADTIRPTLGPAGRTVVLQAMPAPRVASDAAAICDGFTLEDPIADMGAQMLRCMAEDSKILAGDGMAISMVLAQSLMETAMTALADGVNPVALRQGIEGAAQLAAAAVKRLAQPANTKARLVQVAESACVDGEIANIVADAVDRVGADGLILVEESGSRETVLEVAEGMQFERGCISPMFYTDLERTAVELHHPAILVTDSVISSAQSLIPLLEQAVERNRSLLIIADDVTGDALATLLQNSLQGVVRVAAVKAPAYGEGRLARLEDLAVYTGAVFFSSQTGSHLEQATLEQLGSAERVHIDRSGTSILGGAGQPGKIRQRIAMLQAMLQKAEYPFDRNVLRERMARLAGRAAMIRVGAVTELEQQARKRRVENGLAAVRAAVAEGVAAGGGTVLVDLLPAVEAYAKSLDADRQRGAAALARALPQPLLQISANAGYDGRAVVERVRQLPMGVGLDVVHGQYTDMVQAGILDSVRALRLAILRAASVAGVFITTEAAIAAGERNDISANGV